MSKVTYYEDFYGSTASLKEWGSKWILTVRLPSGDLYSKKSYPTYKGAKIALGRMGDAWRERK